METTGEPEAGWFRRMAEQSGDMYTLIQINPEVRIEHLSGDLAATLGLADAVASDGLLPQGHVDPRDAHLLSSLVTMAPGDSRQLELRWNLPDGRTVWTADLMTCRERPDGSVVVEGVVHDITGLKQAQADLATSERRYRLLVENAWDVIWTMGLDGSITYISPAIERVRGFTPEEAKKQSLDQIHPPADAQQTMEFFTELFTAIATGADLPTFRGEKAYFRKDGSIMTGDLQVIPHVDEEGNVVEILGVTRDISDRKLFEEELHRMAVTDPLTGVWNRGHGEALMIAGISAARRCGQPMSVLMLDIDHFKAVNDTQGHEAGDRVLVTITGVLAEHLHDGDVLSRWGGEEFILVLANRDAERAVRLAESLRAQIAQIGAAAADVTVSIGVAQLRADDTANSLLDRADQALYDAKRAGRNAVASRV